jgi:hypothetical protein
MYISLTWTPLGTSDPDLVEGEILAGLALFKFTNFFPPFEGLFLADISKGETRQQVQLLHSHLLAQSDSRFSYVITVSPNFSALAASDDLPPGDLAKIVNFAT